MGFTTLFFDPGHRKTPGVPLCGGTPGINLCYDDEPATVAAMSEYAKAHGYTADFGENRFHHEIYLSDVRRCKPESLKTVVRHPVRKVDQV